MKKPNNLEAERAILGSILLTPRLIDQVASAIDQDDFFSSKHAAIFGALLQLADARAPIDAISLVSQLQKDQQLEIAGGLEYVSNLADTIPGSANLKYYTEIVKGSSDLRQLMEVCHDCAAQAAKSTDPDQCLEAAERSILAIRQQRTAPLISSLTAAQATETYIKERLYKKDKRILTQWENFDNLVRLSAKKLIFIGARPSFGKTAFLYQIIVRNQLDGLRGALFTPEMSREECFSRFICSIGGFDLSRAIDRFEEGKLSRAAAILGDLSRWKLWIDDRADCNLTDLLSSARWQAKTEGLDYIAVDYIQLMNGFKGVKYINRAREIADICNGLKGLAKDLNIPVLCLFQLNRDIEKRGSSEPRMSDAKEGGSIEESADVMAFLHRPLDLNGDPMEETDIIVRKNRSGRRGRVKLRFEGATQRFYEI